MTGKDAVDVFQWAKNKEIQEHLDDKNLHIVVDKDAPELCSTHIRKNLSQQKFDDVKEFLGDNLTSFLRENIHHTKWLPEFE